MTARTHGASLNPSRFPMARNAFAELRQNPWRIIAVVVAITISVGYLAASVIILATEKASLENSVITRVSNTDAVVTVADEDPVTQRRVTDRVRALPGVRSADLGYLSHGRVSGSSEWLQLQSVPDNPALRWTEPVAGHWPAAPDEIALGSITARQLNLRLGDRITINDSNSSATLRVSGLTRDRDSLLVGLAQNAFVAPSYFSGADSIHASLQTEVLVIGDGTVTADRLTETISASVGGQQVEKTAAFLERKVREQTGGLILFELLLLLFGAVALLVGGILIANTFLILVAGRRRQIGLLRAVGAGGPQLRRTVLIEGLVIGAVGSALGCALGIGVSAAVVGEELTVPVPRVAAAGLVGLVITVLSVLVPARRATRISPLDALRTVPDRVSAKRSTVVRNVGAAVLVLGGLGAIAAGFGDSPYALLISVGGCLLCAVGLLAGTGFFLPSLVRLFGTVVGRFGVTGRLATHNAVRDPGRAATTAAALILAVSVIVTLQVGTASTKSTVDSNLDARFPVDVTVSMFDRALPDKTLGEVAAIPEIVAAAPVPSARVALDAGSGPRDLRVLGPGRDTEAAVTAGFAAISDAVVLADPYLLADSGIRDRQPVTLTGRSGSVTLPVVPHYLAPADTLIVSPAVLRTLDTGAGAGTVWAKATPDADITALRSRLRALIAPIPGAEVGGALSARVSYHELLDQLLLVSTMLLAIAVVIALLGVGNTLGLSVIERTRESALLRALGLQRGQLRWMLAAEAVLLSLSAIVVGIGTGAFFGWVGTHALSAELGFDLVRYAISVPHTLAVAGVALVAGMLASVLPARRAANATPTHALAET
jgi:putative ABC transport system permease protein